MPDRPTELARLVVVFAPLFSRRVWGRACALLEGAVLTPGRRTVTAALRVLGRAEDQGFQSYHRVLNRARWSALVASRLLLRLLIKTFTPKGPVVVGLDDTLERRRGQKISARGIYRDPVRSSKGFFVKASGLRWLSLMLLTPISWADRVWALPFLTVLSPSRRYYEQRGRPHKKLTERASQMLLQLRRWLPERQLIVVADSSFSALEFLDSLNRYGLPPAYCITRLRLDAALYEPAPPRQPAQRGRPRKKGRRLPTLKAMLDDADTHWQRVRITGWYSESARELEISSGTAVWTTTGKPVVHLRWVVVRDPDGELEPQAFLCTLQAAEPVQILRWFVQRWSVEVTFAEARAHLGVETQRQWNDQAIARTTPSLFGLYSLVTLAAEALVSKGMDPVPDAAWYPKRQPTFSDALAWVRRDLWRARNFAMSAQTIETVKIPKPLLDQLTDTLCYAA
jgi:hypothetical protein